MMMRNVIPSAARNLQLILALIVVSTANAQTLVSRVNAAPDGVVRMQVQSRSGVCGDGKELVGFRSAIFARNFESMGGHWSSENCVPGNLRITINKDDGAITRVRTQVGGPWQGTAQPVTDLGAVSPAEASAYFFSLVPRLDRGGKDRLLIPAVLADVDPAPVQPLLALARNDERSMDMRRSAIQWVGLLGDASVVPALTQLARDDVDDDGSDKPGKKSLGGSAVSALSMLEDGVGIPALIELARSGSVGTRRNAVFWLGQNGDPRGLRMLHTVIENADEAVRVRSHAVFSLAHGRDAPASEFAWLRSVYPRLREETIRDAILQGMTEDESPAAGTWMIERALNDDSRKVRKQALFWAGQREETPTADLVRVYRDAPEEELREHAIFVLSQRQDDAAVEALMRIAREDRDTRMRGKALFWLAQKDDPRVKKLIADIVLKP
jgi:HEAT repeat protein